MMAVPNQTYVNPNSNETCGVPGTDSWQILRAPIGSDMPWPGFLLGQTPASIWYWCADQIMVQKALSAKSLNHAQGTNHWMKRHKNESLNPGYQKEHFEPQQAILASLTTF